MVAIRIAEWQRIAGEVREAYIDEYRLVADVERALELDVHLQLRQAAVEEAEESQRNKERAH